MKLTIGKVTIYLAPSPLSTPSVLPPSYKIATGSSVR
jgi:hypothetical protein